MDIKSKPDRSSSDGCGAELHIADDYGDNHATIRCGSATSHRIARTSNETALRYR
jgi:hypothetical protein